MKINKNSTTFLQLKRTYLFFKRKYKQKLNKARKKENNSYITTHFYMRKKHISAYQSIGGKSARVKSNRRKHTLLIPKVFTLYNAPENVLMITKEVADLINHKHINHLHIDHRKCEQHDLSAELLLANAVRSLDALKTKNGARFKISGNFPENEKMKRLLSSIGVVKETAAKRYHLNNKNDLKLYKKISDPNEKESLFSNNRKKDATTEFVPYIDDCLSFINARMDREESTKLNHYLGEVLGNAEEHSGEKLWTLLGYLDAKNPDDLYCEIVILNIGKTIYQTFDEKRNVEIVNGSWQSYLAKHLGKLNEEQLTLVHSMQQNISSKLDEQIDRGQGSKHLINLFHHLTEECNRLNLENNVTSSSKPQMLILSGGAMLKFDGTYKPSEDSKGLMRFALNSENSIEIEPDECYIPSLRHGVAFPGTTIYIRFSLQQSELVSL